MKPVIETHALCKSYHSRPVVDHLNLTVPEGCVYGFLGPNGAGKSTTMKMLLGLVHPTGGSVELLGHTLNESNRIALLRQTGSLIESPSGYLHLTARENLSIVADLKDVDRKDISRVLEIVHLTKDADRKVGQYSLGMKQRLGIAMALLGSPKLLILDEPTNGLDPAGIQEMRSLIASMPQTTGATVLISSHLLGEIEQMVDQVGILNHGKVLLERSLSDLQDNTVKLQVAYQGVTEPPLPAELNILHRSHVGRVYTYIVRGSSQEIMRRMQITEPVLLESIPLTLEEIFIYELGGVDYAAKDILL